MTVQINVSKALEGWAVGFKIDNQEFYLQYPTKKLANWYAKCLREAFDKLTNKSQL